jgi:hypothetical protein
MNCAVSGRSVELLSHFARQRLRIGFTYFALDAGYIINISVVATGH